MRAAFSDSCGFAPDAVRARGLDHRIRQGLADSLETIFNTIPELGIDVRERADLICAIRQHRVRPGVFGLYTDLVEALSAGNLVSACGFAQAACDLSRKERAARAIVTLDDAELGPRQAERYRRLIDDQGVGYVMHAVSRQKRRATEQLLESAFELLEQEAPDLASEIYALAPEIVIVEGAANADGIVFDGATTFYLWGALFLNAARDTDRVRLAIALTHEAAHALLFGITLGCRLVENSDSERYPSPLRDDPRPMEGLVHAIYVLARMTWCLDTLFGSTRLPTAEKQFIAEQQAACREQYRVGAAIIRDHARFVPHRIAVFEAAERYMKDSA